MRKGRKRGLLTALAVIVGIGALIGASVLAAVIVCSNAAYAPEPSDCIVVLGAHVWMDGHLSDALRYRCEKALEAWHEGLAPAIIVCGGQGADEPSTEAEAMRDWLTARGVPEAAILMDAVSVNTRENLANAHALMKAGGFQTALICTNSYHVRRALWLAADEGIEARPLAARSLSSVSGVVRNYLRETVSWGLYFIRKL